MRELGGRVLGGYSGAWPRRRDEVGLLAPAQLQTRACARNNRGDKREHEVTK